MYLVGVYSLLKQMCEARLRSRPGSREFPDQTGKVAIVTGGAAGIGLHITRTLVKHNCTVIIASRCEKEAQEAILGIQKDFPAAQVMYMHLDLSSLKSVKEFSDRFLQKSYLLHLLINNAGVMLAPHQCTEDGYELHYQVNFLSHFYLTQLLLDTLRSSGRPRCPSVIVNVSSSIHLVADPIPSLLAVPGLDSREEEVQYSAHNAYAVSKLAIILMTYKLAGVLRTDNSPVIVNSVHPGVVNSDLYHHVHGSIRWFILILAHLTFKTIRQGADTVLDVALSPHATAVSGRYFDNGCSARSSQVSHDLCLQEKLWHHSIEGLKKNLFL